MRTSSPSPPCKAVVPLKPEASSVSLPVLPVIRAVSIELRVMARPPGNVIDVSVSVTVPGLEDCAIIMSFPAKPLMARLPAVQPETSNESFCGLPVIAAV